jgi:fructose-1,6-bisphosphatase/inositol monophosphatase family enzyme
MTKSKNYCAKSQHRSFCRSKNNLLNSDIIYKAKDDIVTSIDRDCESYLASRLPSLLAGLQAIGEESVHENPELLSALQYNEPVWVIDRIDGTWNYVSGNGPFAIMVCLIRQAETLAAWIHDPVEDLQTTAERGCGHLCHFLTINGDFRKSSSVAARIMQ